MGHKHKIFTTAHEITCWGLKRKIRKVKMFKALLEVLMAENSRIMAFGVVTPSNLLDGYERFVGKCCHLLQRKLCRRRHPLSTLHTKASSEASFTCKSSLPPLGNSFGNFLSLYRWNLQLTVHSSTWCQRICSSSGIWYCTIYVTFGVEYRGVCCTLMLGYFYCVRTSLDRPV